MRVIQSIILDAYLSFIQVSSYSRKHFIMSLYSKNKQRCHREGTRDQKLKEREDLSNYHTNIYLYSATLTFLVSFCYVYSRLAFLEI